jgi:hypothetical protein
MSINSSSNLLVNNNGQPAGNGHNDGPLEIRDEHFGNDDDGGRANDNHGGNGNQPNQGDDGDGNNGGKEEDVDLPLASKLVEMQKQMDDMKYYLLSPESVRQRAQQQEELDTLKSRLDFGRDPARPRKDRIMILIDAVSKQFPKESKFEPDSSQPSRAAQFMEIYESATSSLKCTSEEKAQVFRLALSQDAQTWYYGLPKDTRGDWAKIKESFQKRFSKSDPSRSAFLQLGSLHQNQFKKRDIKLYTDRFRQLVQQCNMKAVPDNILTSLYVNGLTEKLQQAVLDKFDCKLPDDIEAVITAALDREEARTNFKRKSNHVSSGESDNDSDTNNTNSESSDNEYRTPNKSKSSKHKSKRAKRSNKVIHQISQNDEINVQAVTTKESTHIYDASSFEHILSELRKSREENKALNEKIAATPQPTAEHEYYGDYLFRGRSRGRGRGRGCGRGGRGGFSYPRDPASIQCFACHQYGHYQSECPRYNPSYQHGLPPTAAPYQTHLYSLVPPTTSAPSLLNQVPGPVKQDPSPVAQDIQNVTMSFIKGEPDQNNPIVINHNSDGLSSTLTANGRVDGVRTIVVLDSGAGVSCINTRLFNQMTKETQHTLTSLSKGAPQINNADGSPFVVHGQITAQVHIGKHSIGPVQMYVLDGLSAHILLGAPDMKRSIDSIHFDIMRVKLKEGDRSAPLRPFRGSTPINLTTIDPCTIPPRTEIIIPTRAQITKNM